MEGNSSLYSWIVLLPIALMAILISMVAISNFRNRFRSLDFFLGFIIFVQLLNVCIVSLIPLVLYLQQADWSHLLCAFYIWSFVTFRFVETLIIFALSIDRILIVRLPGKYKYHVSTNKKILVLFLWIVSAFLGAIPVCGWPAIDLIQDKKCQFLSYEINHNFAVFMAVSELTLFMASLVCFSDVLLQMKYFTVNAMFTVKPTESPPTKTAVAGDTDIKISEFLTHSSQTLASAYDNCRLAAIVAIAILLLNHFPYIVSPAITLFHLFYYFYMNLPHFFFIHRG